MNEKDLEMAKRISAVMEDLNRQAFKEKPIETVVLEWSPPEEKSRFAYSLDFPILSGEIIEAYLIHKGGLCEMIEREKQRALMLFSIAELLKNNSESPQYSLEEVLIGIVSHETRHRLQHYFPERRFSPNHRQQASPYFEILIRYVEKVTRQTYSPEELEKVFENEFDAAFIEHFVVESWHWGERNMSEIAKIIISGPKYGYLKQFFN